MGRIAKVIMENLEVEKAKFLWKMKILKHEAVIGMHDTKINIAIVATSIIITIGVVVVLEKAVK